jgi:hypothetical protein
MGHLSFFFVLFVRAGCTVDRSFLAGYFGFPGFRSCLRMFAVEYLVPLRVAANLAKLLVRQVAL